MDKQQADGAWIHPTAAGDKGKRGVREAVVAAVESLRFQVKRLMLRNAKHGTRNYCND
jgi:hypothetical protein